MKGPQKFLITFFTWNMSWRCAVELYLCLEASGVAVRRLSQSLWVQTWGNGLFWKSIPDLKELYHGTPQKESFWESLEGGERASKNFLITFFTQNMSWWYAIGLYLSSEANEMVVRRLSQSLWVQTWGNGHFWKSISILKDVFICSRYRIPKKSGPSDFCGSQKIFKTFLGLNFLF